MMTRRPWGEVLTPATAAPTSMMYQNYYSPSPTPSWRSLLDGVGHAKELHNCNQRGFSGLCSSICGWTSEENKLFEELLAEFDGNTPDRWLKVSEKIPGKSPRDVEDHYRDLEADVSQIEAEGYSLALSPSSLFSLDSWENGNSLVAFDSAKHAYCKRKGVEQERKKGVPWTEDEHRRFLLGLRKHGKGDWRNISRNFVQTKTSTQVASHAQKYFIRLNSGGKDKRRSSIHDITTANLPDNKSLSPPHPSTVNSCNASTLSDQFSMMTDQNQPSCEIPSLFNGGNKFMHSQFEASHYRMN